MTADEANSGDPERQDHDAADDSVAFFVSYCRPERSEGPAFQRLAGGGFFGSTEGGIVSFGAGAAQNAVTCGATYGSSCVR
jgi:hypothetical protein